MSLREIKKRAHTMIKIRGILRRPRTSNMESFETIDS